MKTAILIGLATVAGVYFLTAPAAVDEMSDDDYTIHFTKFIADFGRQYKDHTEYRVRFGHFVKNLKVIL